MTLSRRRFLELGGLVTATGVTTSFWMTLGGARAFEPGQAGSPYGKKLLVLLLSGGNDGFNTVVPHSVPNASTYTSRRPTIAVQDPLDLGGGVGLHPSLKKLHQLFHVERQVAVVNGVGYDTPDLSHFSSMDIMQTGSPVDRTSRTGWLGRWMDATDHGGVVRAVAIGNTLPPLLVGHDVSGVAVPSFGGFAFGDGTDTSARGDLVGTEPWRLHEAFLACADPSTDDVVARALMDADRKTVGAVRAVNRLGDTKAPPPRTLADQVSMAVKLLESPLDVDVAFVQLPGFDTHANEASGQAALLAQVDEAIARFVADVAATGHPDDHLLMTFSEFGRRLAENGTTGTDHGTANPIFLVGAGVKPGLHGGYPDLAPARLDANGNVVRTVEIREVYATIIDGWLGGADSRDILGYTSTSGIRPLDLLKPLSATEAPADGAGGRGAAGSGPTSASTGSTAASRSGGGRGGVEAGLGLAEPPPALSRRISTSRPAGPSLTPAAAAATGVAAAAAGLAVTLRNRARNGPVPADPAGRAPSSGEPPAEPPVAG